MRRPPGAEVQLRPAFGRYGSAEGEDAEKTVDAVGALIARNFAEAVTAIAYVERSFRFGQVMTEIVEVSPIVERSANRPSFLPLFKYDIEKNKLHPTGNRPMRKGYRAVELGLPDSYFVNSN